MRAISSEAADEGKTEVSPTAIRRHYLSLVLRQRENRVPAREEPGRAASAAPKTASSKLLTPFNNQGKSLLVALAVTAGLVLALLLILPAADQARTKALRIEQNNRLKQIGLAVRVFGPGNQGASLSSLRQLAGLGIRADWLVDPLSGKPFTLWSSNVTLQNPASVLVLGAPDKRGNASALLADGSIQMLNTNQYSELLRSRPLR
jgi:hypothetical protein